MTVAERSAEDSLAGLLKGLMPERSVEDVLAGRVRFRFGDQVFTLPVLSIAENREWKETLDNRLTAVLEAVAGAGDDNARIAAAFEAGNVEFLDVLTSYDKTGVLPAREQLERMARPAELIVACMEVWAAQNPLLVIAQAALEEEGKRATEMAGNLLAEIEQIASTAPTSSPSESGDSEVRPNSNDG